MTPRWDGCRQKAMRTMAGTTDKDRDMRPGPRSHQRVSGSQRSRTSSANSPQDCASRGGGGVTSDLKGARRHLDRACYCLCGDDDTSCEISASLEQLIEASAVIERIRASSYVVPLRRKAQRRRTFSLALHASQSQRTFIRQRSCGMRYDADRAAPQLPQGECHAFQAR